MAADTLHTSGVYLVQNEKSRLNYYDVTIDRPAQLVTMTKKNHKGTQSKEYIASDPWGPISGAMMALTQDFRARQDLRVRRVQRQPALRLRVRGR